MDATHKLLSIKHFKFGIPKLLGHLTEHILEFSTNILNSKQFSSQSMSIFTSSLSKHCFGIFRTSDARETKTKVGKLKMSIPKYIPFEIPKSAQYPFLPSILPTKVSFT